MAFPLPCHLCGLPRLLLSFRWHEHSSLGLIFVWKPQIGVQTSHSVKPGSSRRCQPARNLPGLPCPRKGGAVHLRALATTCHSVSEATPSGTEAAWEPRRCSDTLFTEHPTSSCGEAPQISGYPGKGLKNSGRHLNTAVSRSGLMPRSVTLST